MSTPVVVIGFLILIPSVAGMILSAVMLMGIISFSNGQGDQTNAAIAKEQISAFRLALGQYKLDVGTFPTTEQGLEALRQQPSGVDQWHGPYSVNDIGPDPWGHPYVYRFSGDYASGQPEITAYGQSDSADHSASRLAEFFGGGFAVICGIASFVGGLLGWLLVMKKRVLQCSVCSAVINAS